MSDGGSEPFDAGNASVDSHPGVNRTEALRKRMTVRFSDVKLIKPEASRAASPELYLVGKGFAPA